MPTYRANPTDKDQTVLEQAENEGGVSVFEDAKTRVVIRGRGGAQRTQNAGTTLRNNAGVVIPWDDKPNGFPGDTVGRA